MSVLRPWDRRPNQRKKMLSVRQEKALRITKIGHDHQKQQHAAHDERGNARPIDIGREEGDGRLREHHEGAEHRRESDDREGHGPDGLALQFAKLGARQGELSLRPAAALGGQPFDEFA